MTSLVIFKAVSDCVNALSTVFGKQQKSLRLYHTLLEKTTVSHTTVIEKHNNAFRFFCMENKENILNKSPTFSPSKIIYSEKVFIDMKSIFETKGEDREVFASIWQHLLCLLALFDPSSGAKAVLEKEFAEMEKSLDDGKEMSLLNSLINSGGNDASSPMDALNNMMSNGMLTELITGLQSGNLDTKKLFGGIKGMVNDMSGSMKGDPQAEKMLMMMNKMMDSMEEGMGGGATPSNSLSPSAALTDIIEETTNIIKNEEKKAE